MEKSLAVPLGPWLATIQAGVTETLALKLVNNQNGKIESESWAEADYGH